MKVKRSYKRIIVIVTALIFIYAGIFYAKEFISNYSVRFNLGSITPPEKGSRVLVFAPHCDDEVLGAGGLIRKTLKNGGTVKVVLITNGDGFRSAVALDYYTVNPRTSDYIKFGYQRQKESVSALKGLGVAEENIVFLGYPDGGVAHMWSTCWDLDKRYLSSHTRSDESPYYNSYTPRAPYTGESILSDIIKIIEAYKPAYIVYPHPNDRHPDHWSTNAFVKYALTVTGYSPKKELLYLVHRGDWPTPLKEMPNMYLVPPAKLKGIGTDWHALDLTGVESNEKAKAIFTYRTQVKILKPLLTAFARKNELLGEYKNARLADFNSPDEAITANEKNRVIKDPLQDYLRLGIDKSADIVGVYCELSKTGNLHVFIETDGSGRGLEKFVLSAEFFNYGRVSRLNLALDDGKAAARVTSRFSITNIAGVKVTRRNKFVHVVIPGGVTGKFQHMFVNAISEMGNYLMDKTAWRMADV